MAVNETGGARALRARLQRDEPLYGVFQRIPHPQLTELAGFAGFDFVVCDTEHTVVSLERVCDLVRSADAAGVPALVRIATATPAAVVQALETGCVGLHAPVVRTAAEAEAIVRATRYPPRGTRGLAMPRRSGYGMDMGPAEWLEVSADAVLTVVQIEDARGVAEASAIAALDGVDVLFVGLTDLSLDLGLPGETAHPAMQAAIDRVIAAAREAGKAAGFPVGAPEAARDLAARGARYFTFDDARLFGNAARAALAAVRGSA